MTMCLGVLFPELAKLCALLGRIAVAKVVQGDAQGRGDRKREEFSLIHL